MEIAATLVDAGADLRQTDLWGNSALDLAFSQVRARASSGRTKSSDLIL